MVAHAFNPSTWEAEVEAGRFFSSRSTWFAEWIPGQPGLYKEILSREKKREFQGVFISIDYIFLKQYIYPTNVQWEMIIFQNRNNAEQTSCPLTCLHIPLIDTSEVPSLAQTEEWECCRAPRTPKDLYNQQSPHYNNYSGQAWWCSL